VLAFATSAIVHAWAPRERIEAPMSGDPDPHDHAADPLQVEHAR
jgi:hypothetical protein